MKHNHIAVLLCGALLLTGCAKQSAPVTLQTGYLDSAVLNEGEPYSEELAANYEMADDSAEPPVDAQTKYERPDGAVFVFDKAGRLRSYTAADSPAASDTRKPEDELRGICGAVLGSYIPDYADYTEILSQYYENDSNTFNLAMEHVIADGIADYALIRLDTAGEVADLSISYADADGDAAQDFVTDADRAYFAQQAQPYLTALEDYDAEVTYTHFKHVDGKLYAFYEITYTDPTAGITAGQKRVIFVK